MSLAPCYLAPAFLRLHALAVQIPPAGQAEVLAVGHSVISFSTYFHLCPPAVLRFPEQQRDIDSLAIPNSC